MDARRFEETHCFHLHEKEEYEGEEVLEHLKA
jgi:hypothetical protein